MAQSTTSRLLDLPAELRNNIYALALSDCKIDTDAQYHHGGASAPGIVFACKQTYRETIDMHYTKATVVSTDRWILNKWLSRLALLNESHRYKLINRIRIDLRNRSEQQLPLQLGQRWSLAHHSDLGLEYLEPALARVVASRGSKMDIKACIVSPSQELVWTATPFGLQGLLQQKWQDMTTEQRMTQSMEQWAPNGVAGIEWSRE